MVKDWKERESAAGRVGGCLHGQNFSTRVNFGRTSLTGQQHFTVYDHHIFNEQGLLSVSPRLLIEVLLAT